MYTVARHLNRIYKHNASIYCPFQVICRHAHAGAVGEGYHMDHKPTFDKCVGTINSCPVPYEGTPRFSWTTELVHFITCTFLYDLIRSQLIILIVIALNVAEDWVSLTPRSSITKNIVSDLLTQHASTQSWLPSVSKSHTDGTKPTEWGFKPIQV